MTELAFPGFGDIFWPIFKTVWPLFVAAVILPLLLRILENYVQQKTFKYFLKRNRIELTTLVFAIIGYIFSYIFISKPVLSFLISIIITFGATSILIYSKIREKDFYFLPLKNDSEKEDWMGDGTFRYERTQNAFAITESESGFIFSKCLTWSDYVLNFDFKILNTSLGVILRATNLSNLVMLQIFDNKIKAHIRINGFWKIWESEDSNLLFNKKLSRDKWYKGQFQCDKRSIRIRLYNMKDIVLFDRVWKIPAGSISFSINPVNNIGLLAKSVISSIPFSINLEYGTFGFRNFNQERALIENVLVEKIQGVNSVD